MTPPPPSSSLPKPKQKEQQKRPSPPPSVTTAYFLLRGVIAGVLGCDQQSNLTADVTTNATTTDHNSNNIAISSPLQPSYIKDKAPTGKFSMNLGRRKGTFCSIEMNASDSEREVNAIYNSIEKSANRLILDAAADNEITYHVMTRGEIIDKYGLGPFDSGNINDTNDDKNKGKNNSDKGKGGKKKKKDKKKVKESNNEDIVTKIDDKDEEEKNNGLKEEEPSKPTLKINPNDEKLTLIHIPNLLLAVLDNQKNVIHTLKEMHERKERIVIEREGDDGVKRGNGSSIVSGKKARKCEIVLKFRIVSDNPTTTIEEDTKKEKVLSTLTSTSTAASTIGVSSPFPDPKYISTLFHKSIRFQEGHDLKIKLADYMIEEELKLLKLEEEKKKKMMISENDNDTKVAQDTNNTNAAATAGVPKKEEEMIVNAFEVSGSINYDMLVNDFGSKRISSELLERLTKLTVGRGTVPYLHRFLRRDIFFSHRDLHKICDCLESGIPIYLYTGRGPSSEAMHLGHLVPFLFTQWLQQAFQCPLVVQMTDDEKFIFKGEYTAEDGDDLDRFSSLAIENARDIIACDFLYDRTFLFTDMNYIDKLYPNIVRIWKSITINQINGIFGFDQTDNPGKIAFPAVQAAPSFASSFPIVLNANRTSKMACLVPCAIDQDPYFRMTRDVASRLVNCGRTGSGGKGGDKNKNNDKDNNNQKHPLGGKPALIHSKFFPPLQGSNGKMSSSNTNSAIFLTDSPLEIERKIKQNAYSGGRDTSTDQKKYGANLDDDVSYQWLRFFLEDDDELEDIGKDYGSGKGKYWCTSMVKNKLIEVLKEVVKEHNVRRSKVTDEVVLEWMKERRLEGL